MKRALKDILMNLVLLPKEDLTDLPVSPYGTENVCKYLGRCLSRHQPPLKKPVAIFSLFSDENVKSDDMGQRIAWQQHQDWTVPDLKQIPSHFHSMNVRSNSTHCGFQSLKINEHIPEVKYKGNYVSTFQYNSIILL